MTPLRVLIVDDDPELLKVMAKVIETRKCDTVVAVRSPHLALEAITRDGQEFDIVFADLLMPRMSGDAFLGHIRELLPRARRVLITGFSGLLATELEEGLVDDIIEKPFDNADLIAVLDLAQP